MGSHGNNTVSDVPKTVETQKPIEYSPNILPSVFNRNEQKKANAILVGLTDHFVKKVGDEEYYNAWLTRYTGNWCQYIDGELQCDKTLNDEMKHSLFNTLSNYHSVVSSSTYTTVAMPEIEVFISRNFGGKTLVSELSSHQIANLSAFFEEFDARLTIDQKVKLEDFRPVPF